MSAACTRCGGLPPLTDDERHEICRAEDAKWPCTGELGCSGLDVDALPALRLMSGEAYTSEPCDNCKGREFMLGQIFGAQHRLRCRCSEPA